MLPRDTADDTSLPARLATAVEFLGRLDYRNLRMLPNALSILTRPSAADWYYNRDLVSRELPRTVRNFVFAPDDMNAFQRHCPVAGYVSTPVDGVLAGFTERGRMSTLFCPHTGYTQQLPYYETGGTVLDGARPREGAFFGVQRSPAGGTGSDCGPRDDGVTWLWESSFDHEMASGPAAGELSLTYEPRQAGPVAATERVFVPPGSETVVRELTVRNVSDRRIARVLYYMQANANDNQQYVPGITSPNRVVAGDRGVEWRDRRSDRRLELSAADSVAGTGVVTGPLDDALADARRVRTGRHVGGVLSFDAPLEPGAETTVTVRTGWGGAASGDGANEDETATDRSAGTRRSVGTDVDGREHGPETRVRTDGAADAGTGAADASTGAADAGTGAAETTEPTDPADPAGTVGSAGNDGVLSAGGRRASDGEVSEGWATWLADVPVEQVPERFADQYERSVAGVTKLFDPVSGSLSAAPNFQPTYYPSWPRDGAFVAVALAEAGVPGPAVAYLGRFLPSVQGADGGFEQCYTSDGAPAGVIPRENDQQPIYVHAVRAVDDVTDDDALVRAAWPAVADALDYTVDAIADNGLLRATPDFAEMPTHARQSLWTNAFAYRGLLDGAALADRVGADGERYRRAAARVGDAVERTFFADRDRFATQLTIRGAERDGNVAFSAAVHPTGWAADYGYTEPLLDGFAEIHRDGAAYWLPREFTYAAALYAAGRESEGDRVLAALQTERLPGGTLAEEVDRSGDHNFAALAWANAAFAHALHVREGIAADVS
ncbi:glycoside hydrolase family 15 protein [Halosimplex salinum]|uniref:hypothetical protein n=1 Tax=Halosimplex salinum TaxID=1710538 RepID=UPI000F4613E9|nr:hypothetical protein [Halosimplex salinum]